MGDFQTHISKSSIVLDFYYMGIRIGNFWINDSILELTLEFELQVTYAHSGMSVNKFGACKYNDTMKAFMNRCQVKQ